MASESVQQKRVKLVADSTREEQVDQATERRGTGRRCMQSASAACRDGTERPEQTQRDKCKGARAEGVWSPTKALENRPPIATTAAKTRTRRVAAERPRPCWCGGRGGDVCLLLPQTVRIQPETSQMPSRHVRERIIKRYVNRDRQRRAR